MYKAIKELEKREKADLPKMDYDAEIIGFCPACKTDTPFTYVGYDLGIFPQRMIETIGLARLVEKHGDKLILYDCSNCNSSASLARLKSN